MSKITLTYFNAPGRAHGIRVALFTAGVAFEDKRIEGKDWPALKPKTHGGSLPVLEIDGKMYTQSAALARWAGKKSTMYPKDDIEALRCDEVMAIGEDLLAKTPSSQDPAEKKRLREEFAKGFMKLKCDMLEQYCAEAGDNFVSGGKDLTIADLSIQGLCDMVKSGNFDYVDPSYMDAYPKMLALAGRVASSDILKKYEESQKK
eukprot:CAMPEP_0174928928 /NCGR_PEP_ID=MMETSP1355-20121228/26857_1 /TAXON_ID=464990 /ORGANISM="Hemiselmis tepida, Strain CCMP443" /LENGTH=203 /DNA_ID=CAMNT_0016175111 /DNA_START=48 /DNA_END=659 /DNA_ORIENTATION=-